MSSSVEQKCVTAVYPYWIYFDEEKHLSIFPNRIRLITIWNLNSQQKLIEVIDMFWIFLNIGGWIWWWLTVHFSSISNTLWIPLFFRNSRKQYQRLHSGVGKSHWNDSKAFKGGSKTIYKNEKVKQMCSFNTEFHVD